MEKLGMTFDRRFVHDGHEVIAYAKSNPRIATIAQNIFEGMQQSAAEGIFPHWNGVERRQHEAGKHPRRDRADERTGYRIDWKLYYRLLRLGLPAAYTSMERALSQLVMVGIVASFGPIALAVYSLAQRRPCR